MEFVLKFLSDLILFTGGLFVVGFWLIILIVIMDEIIDAVVSWRNPDRDDS